MFSERRIQNMWDSNPHGAGIMYQANGKVYVVKGLMTVEDFNHAVKDIGRKRPMVMHFRIKTHGNIIPELTHPFWIEQDKLAMVHNGIVSWLIQHTTNTLSDTAIYAQWIPYTFENPWYALNTKETQARIRNHSGWSKFAFLHASGRVLIINKESGCSEPDGSWFSNEGYKNLEDTEKYVSYVYKAKDWDYSKWVSSEAKKSTTETNPEVTKVDSLISVKNDKETSVIEADGNKI